MLFNEDNSNQLEFLQESIRFTESSEYDLWMRAEIQRLQGEYWLSRGDLTTAKTKLIQSIENNKKEAKTWLSYAKLNEMVFSAKKDSKSI